MDFLQCTANLNNISGIQYNLLVFDNVICYNDKLVWHYNNNDNDNDNNQNQLPAKMELSYKLSIFEQVTVKIQ